MKVLIVYSGNTESPFITEQVGDLRKAGIITDYYRIKEKGLFGYLKSLTGLKSKIAEFYPNIVHAHFGLSGVLANLQRKVPVVTTYHGCDINKFTLRLMSLPSLTLSRFNIFVSFSQYRKVRFLVRKKYQIIPCGINLKTFYPVNMGEARKLLGFDLTKKYILFSSSFDIPVKNAKLAKAAMDFLGDEFELLEFKNYNRDKVNLLMNACNVGLLTSIREGSPMFVKELLATNTPVVSTNVGDVQERISNVRNSYIANNDPIDIAEKIKLACEIKEINGREEILDIEGSIIANEIIDIYNKIYPY